MRTAVQRLRTEEESIRTRNRLREPLINIDEVAERLGVSTRYVRRLVAERRIAYLKVGRLLRFDADVVDSWLAACGVNANEGRALASTVGPTKPIAHRSIDPSKIEDAEARPASMPRYTKARQSR